MAHLESDKSHSHSSTNVGASVTRMPSAGLVSSESSSSRQAAHVELKFSEVNIHSYLLSNFFIIFKKNVVPSHC